MSYENHCLTIYNTMLQTKMIAPSGQIPCQTKFKIFSLNSYWKFDYKKKMRGRGDTPNIRKKELPLFSL